MKECCFECLECRFYSLADLESKEGPRGYKGECRRNVPSGGPDRWPTVYGKDWCGEWKGRGDVDLLSQGRDLNILYFGWECGANSRNYKETREMWQRGRGLTNA